MRRVLEFVGAAALTGGAPIGSAQIAKESRPTSQPVEMQAGACVNDIIDRVVAREHEEMKIINSYRPIVETHVQVYKRKRDTTASLAVLLGPRRLESHSPLRHMIWGAERNICDQVRNHCLQQCRGNETFVTSSREVSSIVRSEA
jgi:hypothetical protein